jgi:hypothetical protein
VMLVKSVLIALFLGCTFQLYLFIYFISMFKAQ